MRAFALSLLMMMVAWLSGCATTPSPETKKTDAPAARSAPAPRYNLTGYSPAFKAGYADACAAPRRRSDARFKSDDEYRMGWQDGSSVCKTRQ